jgi:hypothetical protein
MEPAAHIGCKIGNASILPGKQRAKWNVADGVL